MSAPGTLTGDSLANFNEFFSVLEPYIEAVAKSKEKKLSSQWKEGYQKILDAYLGKCPDTFSYKGKTYTPQSFAASLGLDWNDYVSISSFTTIRSMSILPSKHPTNGDGASPTMCRCRR